MDITKDTPNIQLATTRMLEWTVPQLECYICCHGLRVFRRSVLRDLLQNCVHWQVLVVIAQTLYRHEHLWSVVQVFQFEGYIPNPPGQSDWTSWRCLGLVTCGLLRRMVLGSRAPNFFLPLNLWHAL